MTFYVLAWTVFIQICLKLHTLYNIVYKTLSLQIKILAKSHPIKIGETLQMFICVPRYTLPLLLQTFNAFE